VPPASEVAEFRRSLVALTDLTVSDLEALWRAWPWSDPQGVVQAASEIVPDLVWAYQDVSGTLAADQYDSWREAERVRGRFRASPAQLADEDQILAGVRSQLGPLFQVSPDVLSAQSLLQGMVVRQVMRGANDTIVESTKRDPEAAGWKRVARADGCGFCRMLADRGGVYKKKTSRFASHGNCRCGSAPSWDGDEREVPVLAYVASKRKKKPEEREALREYLAEHFPEKETSAPTPA